MAEPHRRAKANHRADGAGDSRRPCEIPGRKPCRPVRRDHHAAGASQGASSERPRRHGGVQFSREDQRSGMCDKADGDVSRALSKLLALTESYPELKANENFLKLQDSLSETEDKIAYSRQFYNDNAKSYRNLVEMFPSNIVAKLFRFEAMPFFEASAEEKAAPKVQF